VRNSATNLVDIATWWMPWLVWGEICFGCL